uniref:Uncharacterized protein n=1 Tax=Rhinopithecus bieti TaxID=61621 RepID=A0A2K6JSY8_RHIBE
MPLPAAHSRLSYTSPRRSTEAHGYFCLEITWRLENKWVGKRGKVTIHSTPFPFKSEKRRKVKKVKTFLELSAPFRPKERIWEFTAL